MDNRAGKVVQESLHGNLSVEPMVLVSYVSSRSDCSTGGVVSRGVLDGLLVEKIAIPGYHPYG